MKMIYMHMTGKNAEKWNPFCFFRLFLLIAFFHQPIHADDQQSATKIKIIQDVVNQHISESNYTDPSVVDKIKTLLPKEIILSPVTPLLTYEKERKEAFLENSKKYEILKEKLPQEALEKYKPAQVGDQITLRAYFTNTTQKATYTRSGKYTGMYEGVVQLTDGNTLKSYSVNLQDMDDESKSLFNEEILKVRQKNYITMKMKEYEAEELSQKKVIEKQYLELSKKDNLENGYLLIDEGYTSAYDILQDLVKKRKYTIETVIAQKKADEEAKQLEKKIHLAEIEKQKKKKGQPQKENKQITANSKKTEKNICSKCSGAGRYMQQTGFRLIWVRCNDCGGSGRLQGQTPSSSPYGESPVIRSAADLQPTGTFREMNQENSSSSGSTCSICRGTGYAGIGTRVPCSNGCQPPCPTCGNKGYILKTIMPSDGDLLSDVFSGRNTARGKVIRITCPDCH